MESPSSIILSTISSVLNVYSPYKQYEDYNLYCYYVCTCICMYIPLLALLLPGKQLDHNHGILFVIPLHTTSYNKDTMYV